MLELHDYCKVKLSTRKDSEMFPNAIKWAGFSSEYLSILVEIGMKKSVLSEF